MKYRIGRIAVLAVLATLVGVAAALVEQAVQAQTQTYSQQATLASDQAFVERVKIGCVRYATNVVGVEAETVAYHVERHRMAGAVIARPDVAARAIAVGVAADLTITANSTDDTLFTRIDFIWTSYARSELAERLK